MRRFLIGFVILLFEGPYAFAKGQVAFLPFRDVLGEKDLEPAGMALAQYLERDVRLVREIPPTVDIAAATAAIRSTSVLRRDRISPIELKMLAQRLDASELFWGSYDFREERRTIGLLHYVTDSGEVTSSERSSVEQSEFAILDELIIELAGKSLWNLPADAAKLLAARETHSFKAYLEALEGKRESSSREWKKAVIHYTRAVGIDPEYAACRLLRGNCRLKLREIAAAKEDFEAAVREKSTDWVVYNNLGIAVRQEGDVRAAIRQYGEGLKHSPDSVILHFNRGNAYALLDMDAETKDDYETCLKVKPDFAPALYQLGLFYGRRGGEGQSIEFWNRAHKADDSLLEECFKNKVPIDDILVWESHAGRMEPKYEYAEKAIR
jgi:tetratricopeptide (TPR) repeat protein